MGRLRTLFARLSALFGKRHMDADLEAELRAHLDMLTEKNVGRGMNVDEARRTAMRAFGGVEQTKENFRRQRGLPFLETLLQDVRYGLRMLAKNPGFAVVAVLTLAVGIGATSAVFSVVDRILFRSLPYPQDERLVSFGVTAPFESREFILSPDYVEWRNRPTPFEAMTSVYPGTVDCDLTEHNPVRMICGQADANFLSTFRIQPILGRSFTRDEERPNAPRVVLLSYGFWRARFAGDPQIVGKSISLDGRSTLIIGVLPADFEMPTLARADLLLPLALNESTVRDPTTPQLVLRAFARFKPGVTIEQAVAAMQPLFLESLNYVPPQFRREVSFRMRSLRDRQVQDARASSWILFGAVLAVLLVACTNVANLLLARAAGRQRELAVRAALGATRGRLARQNLTESLLLAVVGGSAGCWLANLLLRLFVSIAPQGIPRLEQASVDLRVLVFTLGVSLLSGILFALAPALHTPAPELLMGRESRATGRTLLRQTLVTAQIAVSLILLAGAGLLLRSLWNLQSVPLGMETESVLTAEIALAEYRYPRSAQQLAFFRDLEARLQRVPGATSLAMSDSLPPSGGMQASFLSSIEIPGRPKLAEGTGGMIGYRFVTPGYFPALGVAIARGRGFREDDRMPGENPVILSEALAKQLFSNEDPLGKQLRFGSDNGPWRTIVGVAANVKNNGLAAPADPEFYLPWKDDREGYFRIVHLIVQTPINRLAIAQWIRSEAAAIDPTVPVTIEAMRQRVGKLAARPKFNAVLLSIFAGLGVLLAAIGIYGVVGFLVAQRTQEIGIRMALGASPPAVLRMILSHVARWVFAGALLGLAGAWLSSRVLESLLFEVRAHDPWLLGLAVAILLATAFFAAWLPARRAMRVDPIVALRYE
jgi:putative ABC transport system permease protein